MQVEFAAPLWMHDGGWHFVTLPPDLGHDIAEATAGERRGFGSLRVNAEIGGVRWSTSIFPDTASGSFLLPVKKSVREGAGLEVGDAVDVTLLVRAV